MNEQDFLQECGKSYLQVLDALGYFREKVQKQCKDVAEKHIPTLAGVLGVKVAELKQLPHARPDKPSSEGGGYAEIGWKVKRQEDLYIYFFVSWYREAADDSLQVAAQMFIWLKNQGKCDSLGSRLADLVRTPRFVDEPWEYGYFNRFPAFSLTLEESEFSRLNEPLDRLLAFVIPFLKSVEGIQEYFLP